jgi:hypothetical protein
MQLTSLLHKLSPVAPINSIRTWSTIAVSFSILLATNPAVALPLQDGNYRIGSKYIQIASKGDRICYQGKTATRGTTASVAPYSLPDFSVVNFKTVGSEETLVLHQPSIGHLLYGTVHMLTDWEADYEFPRSLDEAMKRCLNSQLPFYEEFKSSR